MEEVENKKSYKDRYQELFERSVDAILIIEEDNFVDCNRAAVKMLRYRTKEDILNTHPSKLSPDVQPDGRLSYEKANEMIAIASEQGSHRFEWDHLRADGEVFTVEVLLTAIQENGRNTLHVVWREISARKKTEKSLRRLTSIVETMNDIVLISTPGGQVEYVNNSGLNILNWEKDNLSDRNILSLCSEWDAEVICQGIQTAIDKGSWKGEATLQLVHRKDIPASLIIKSHKSPRGKVEYLSIIIRDISYHKKVENWQDEQIKLLGVGADIGKCLTEDIDLNEMLQKCCRLFVEHLDAAFCRIWLLNTKENVLELKASAGMYTSLDGSHSRIPMGAFKIGRIAKNKTAHQTGNVIGDPQIHDQEWAKREGMVSFSGYPLIVDDRVIGVLAMFFRHKISAIVDKALTSVSDEIALGILRKQTDQKLLRNIQYLSSIIENIPTCIQLIDINGVVLEMNPAGLVMLGVSSKKSIVGMSIYDFIVDKDKEVFQHFNEEVCKGKKKNLTFSINALDGKERAMMSVAVPLYYSPKGAVVQLGIVQDVTNEMALDAEKAELQNQLSQTQKMESLGTLAGGIAHDFNNILTAIYGYAELAQMDTTISKTLQEDLNEIIHGADRAKELVKQILAFCRKTDHELQPLRIQIILKEVLKLLRSTLPSTIEIRQDICPDCEPVLADPTQIHQVVMNLCTNAYHAMRENGGCLDVSLASVELTEKSSATMFLKPGYYVRLTVSDTGSGIAKDYLGRIFEPYFTTKKQGEGTGLGLAVVHGIIESLNGKITVDSIIDKGTTFNVYMPALQLKAGKNSKTAADTDVPMGKERILFVDDDKVIVELQQINLESLGYTVTGVTNSVIALQIFREEPNTFDLLITDMTMPDMTGEELSKKVLAIRPGMPIILCTGYSSRINEEKAKKIGISAFAEKPLSRINLAKIIRKALRT